MQDLIAILRRMKSLLKNISSLEGAQIPTALGISDIRRTITGRGQISWMDAIISDAMPRVTCIYAVKQSGIQVKFASMVRIELNIRASIDGIVPIFRNEGNDGGVLEYLDENIIFGMSIYVTLADVISLYARINDDSWCEGT